jgi:hypothetical protein
MENYDVQEHIKKNAAVNIKIIEGMEFDSDTPQEIRNKHREELCFLERDLHKYESYFHNEIKNRK